MCDLGIKRVSWLQSMHKRMNAIKQGAHILNTTSLAEAQLTADYQMAVQNFNTWNEIFMANE